MDFVLGSGPAGAAAAVALAGRGVPVTMLDAGGELETVLRDQATRLTDRAPENWRPDEVEAIRGKLRYNSEGAPLKLLFGSDYPYRDVDLHEPVRTSGVDAYRSLALGGLSVLWGASVLPYSDPELEGWPLKAAELDEHYRAVLRLTGLSAERDELERYFPLHAEPTENLKTNRQADSLLKRMRRNETQLAQQGLRFGKARLAIRRPNASSSGCAHCGLCLYGCPYGLIYSSRDTVLELSRSNPSFKYVPGQIVRKLVEKNGTVQIHAVSRESGRESVFEATRVFLATGAYSSTRILLESLGAYERTVDMPQSDHFLIPLLLTEGASGIAKDRQHTLSQIFLELMDPEISRHKIHLQVYTYNDFYSRMAQQKLGPVYPLLQPILEKAFERVILIKGYLHSEISSKIRARVTRESGSRAVLELESAKDPRSAAALRATIAKLRSNWRRIGALPLGFASRMGAPGSGVHLGGSFPMRERPGEFESDLSGRPTGFGKVHVVDSTVFPTVPAPTITLTAMANAHRIALKETERCSG